MGVVITRDDVAPQIGQGIVANRADRPADLDGAVDHAAVVYVAI